MRVLYYLLLLVLVLLGATFAALNMQTVTINYYVAKSSLPLALLLGLTFASGCILGFFLGLWLLLKSKLKHFRLRQRLSLVEKELENLRALPLRDKH